MVSFTIEGYFHYVLGEVIEKMAKSKANFLKDLLQYNKLNGIREGVDQCLVRDVEKGELNRLIWLIDQGGKVLDFCVYPLAKAFIKVHGKSKTEEEFTDALQKQIIRVLDELFTDSSGQDLKVLSKTIDLLKSFQLNQPVKEIYIQIHKRIQPNTISEAELIINSVEHLSKDERKEKLESILNLEKELKIEDLEKFYDLIGFQYKFLSEYAKAKNYYEKALEINLKLNGDKSLNTGKSYNNLGVVLNEKGEYDRAIENYEKGLEIVSNFKGYDYPGTGTFYNNLGLVLKNGECINLKFFKDIWNTIHQLYYLQQFRADFN